MSIAFASSAESPAGSVCILASIVFRLLRTRLSAGHRALTGCPLAVDFDFWTPQKRVKPNA